MPMIKFLDLSIKDINEKYELNDAFNSLLDCGNFIITDTQSEFEEVFAKQIGRSYCVGVNSGTDALILGLKLLSLPEHKYVLTTPFSWIASSTSILINNLQPYFVDIGTDLQINLDIVEAKLKDNPTKYSAILVPHLHGNVTNLSRISALRSKYSIRIIEDCAQAFGANDINNCKAGSVGDIATFSFNPMKTLGAIGDAGAILTDNLEVANRARVLRHSGVTKTNILANELSYNCRIDALQAKLLLVRMKYHEKKQNQRREIAKVYLMYCNMLGNYVQPVCQDVYKSNHYNYQILAKDRDQLITYMASHAIETRVRHIPLITDHPIFLKYSSSLPVASSLIDNILCLPMHHNMSIDDAHYVGRCLLNFYDLL